MRVRLALLGCAHVHAAGYVALLGGRADVELLGFSEDDPTLAAGFATSSGLTHQPLEQLLGRKPHGVIICSETVRHRPLVEAAAAAGAQVLCEKPIATTEADSLAMRVACDAAGVRFVTAFPARFSSAVRTLAAQLRSGGLGSVLNYSGVNHSVAPDRHHPWFADPALSGGGAGMDHIVHLADLLRLFGERPTEVYAHLRPVPEWLRPDHAGTDAAGLVTLRLASGANATIDCSWSRPPGYPRWGQLRLDVTGTAGLVSLDVFADVLARTTAVHTWAGYGEDLNLGMLDDFLGVCREGRPGQADWSDGHEALRVVLAAYASSALGQPVPLPEQ